MNRFLAKTAIAAAAILAGVSTAQATLVSANAVVSSGGTAAQIIVAPADVYDDSFTHNTGIQAFNERQSYTLTQDLAVDSGTISAGTVVSSHMVFLNSNGDDLLEHGFTDDGPVTYTFSDEILGVMSDQPGELESLSQYLGAAGTAYPAKFNARGLEGNPLSGTDNDWYTFSGNTLDLAMRVTEPGDWIRVVTAAPSSVPEPGSLALLGLGLAGLGFSRRKNKA